MTIGTSLFLLAAGAILRYAVNDSVDSIDLEVVGLILMIVGILGLLLGVWIMQRADRAVAPRDVPRDRL